MEMSKTLQQIKSFARQRNLPLIPVASDNIAIIREPSSFYQTLLDSIKRSEEKIVLSALYLGIGPKERAIVEAIRDKLNANENFNVHMALDAGRATRLDSSGQSSATSMKSLLHYKNVRFDLVRVKDQSSLLSRFLGKFQRWNEVLTTYHAKMMIFDKDVIMTGANLSSNYFETRQDRYIAIKDTKLLSDYLSGLLDAVCLPSEKPDDTIRSYNESFASRTSKDLPETSLTDTTDSYIIPLSQHGPTGITDNEDFLTLINSLLPKGASVHMSTGYFNPSPTIQQLNLSSVLAPSESANGFSGGAGFLKYVPRLYSSLYKHYLDTHKHCALHVYDRPGWSYHAKGVWIEGVPDLYIHLIGSSNYNYRSACRDFETQLVILTKNKGLIEKLTLEREALWQESTVLQANEIKGLNSVYTIVARLLRSFL